MADDVSREDWAKQHHPKTHAYFRLVLAGWGVFGVVGLFVASRQVLGLVGVI